MKRHLGVQFERYYHGTGEHNVESILKEGLKEHNPSEGLYEDEDYEEYEHPKGVYLAGNIEHARQYGDAIFAVDLPSAGVDWKWSSEGYVHSGDIHPYLLRRVE
jgi:hypothetical protein